MREILYNQNFFYSYPHFWELTYRSDRLWIFAFDGSNDADSHNVVPFLGFLDIPPHLGGQIIQKPQFWGVNRHSQAKHAKNSNIHIFETTAPIATKL